MGANNFLSMPEKRVLRPLPPFSFSATFKEARASPPLPPKTSRVLAFHSAAQWKAYFEASKQSNKMIVIDFTATWCRPCRYMDPSVDEFAAKYSDVEFIKIDVDELMNVAGEFGIHAMPTFLLIKNGKEIDKVVGAKKQELQAKIEKHRSIQR
ncbi:hypothetical protein Nepgr_017173 [Nepenthes gracilis]|uniref:Thioredoxin domain-containing protein n=1 Tax=Nepenthes gracilis TaxID=150966 RepID=A0AAD3SRX4_NEPGR|nr:hypothetical protein Nepgr_017173 [Nepenthes gracilis]